jgi:coproporphyrinogen III oxidase
MDYEYQTSANWFRELRDRICLAFEKIENDYTGQLDKLPPGKFDRKVWDRPGGGGGEMSIMRGRIFEKVGVNISTVHGKFSDHFSKQIPGAEENPEFWASGISVVAHMQSPHIPAIHMNLRFITTTKSWFGGGIDLNPIFPIEEDTKIFHDKLKKVCDLHNQKFYQFFQKECEEYFYLPHRRETRGVGGIFFDYLNTGAWHQDFAFIKDVGEVFLEFYTPLIVKYITKNWSEDERKYQLKKRAYYAEFNLLYDRGTKFGLMTDGNPDAILMSMPPIVTW